MTRPDRIEHLQNEKADMERKKQELLRRIININESELDIDREIEKIEQQIMQAKKHEAAE